MREEIKCGSHPDKETLAVGILHGKKYKEVLSFSSCRLKPEEHDLICFYGRCYVTEARL